MSRLVVVTGGAGFVGAHVVRALVAAGDQVRVVDDLSTGHRAYLDGVPHDLVVARTSDGPAVRAALAGARAVIHLAARTSIPESIDDPLGSFEENVGTTVALLAMARDLGVERFVLASSNAALGNHPPPLHEGLVASPTSPYGASKLAGEAYVQAFAATYGMTACALRFSNVYGSWSLHKTSVVAAWIRAAEAGEPLLVNGDGSQTRDYVHANDLAEATLAVIDAPANAVAGQVFQVGAGVETSLLELVEVLRGAVGRPLTIRHGPPRPGDVARNASLCAKADERLGWHARTRLDEGLAGTVAWYRSALADPLLASIVPAASSGSE